MEYSMFTGNVYCGTLRVKTRPDSVSKNRKISGYFDYTSVLWNEQFLKRMNSKGYSTKPFNMIVLLLDFFALCVNSNTL
jgi:hypothetical protein